MNIELGSLRPLEERDLARLLAWRNSERIRKSMISDHLISWDEHLNWFENMNREKNLYLLFEFNDRPAGMVYFNDIDHYNEKCYWGFYLGEKDLPRGAGLLMAYLGLNYVFTEQALRKICSEALLSNPISINFHKKLGFIEEGRLIQQVRKGEDYVDLVLLALFKEQWQQSRDIIKKLFGNTDHLV